MSKCWKDGEWIETSVESINDIGHDKKGNVKLKNVGIDSDSIDFSQDKFVFTEDGITSFRIPGLSEDVFGLTLISDTNLVLVKDQDYTIDIDNETINLLKKFEKGRVIHYFLTKYMQKFENNEKGYIINGKYEFTDNQTTFFKIPELTDDINYINLVTGTNLVLINGQDYTVNKKLQGINLLKEFEAGDVIYYNLEHQRAVLEDKHNSYIPDITVEGRTLTNLLGRAGNAIYKQDWSKTNDNITLEYEQDYFKLTCTEDVAYIAKNIKVKQNSYYLYGCEMYNEDNTGYLTCGTVLGEGVKTKRIENEKYRFYIVTSLNSNEISVAVAPRTIKETIVKNIRVYEISEEEFNKIHSMQYTANQLNELYPYVDDCKSVVNPYFECKDNLLDEKDIWLSGTINTDGTVNEDKLNSFLITQQDNSIRTKQGEYYTVLMNGDIPYEHSLVIFNMRENMNESVEKVIVNEKYATVKCLDTGVLKIGIKFSSESKAIQRLSIVNKINKGLITFTLVKGETPKSYEECHDSRIIFETTLYEGEKITRQNDGSYIKNSEWEKIDDFYNCNFIVELTNESYKNIFIEFGNLTSKKQYAIRYDGKITSTDYSIYTENKNEECFGIDSVGNISFRLPNSLTGWGDDYTPTQEEIKAFFLGWRMCPSEDGNGKWNELYNDATSTNQKQWAKLWCGIGEISIVTGSSGLADVIKGSSKLTCPTTMNDQGYTPYRLIYKKETPTIEEVKTYGELAIKDKKDIISGSGLVLKESYTNHLCTYDETGSETLINCGHNFLKSKPYKILNIINDKGEIESFQDRLYNFIYKPIEAYVNHGYSQAIIKYNNDIKNYFVDYIMLNTVQSYNYTISDKLTLKETLNKTTESISDVYEELAKTKKELEHVKYELSQRSNPNLLINGDFQIWQRSTKFNNIGYKYTADRWCAYNGVSTNSYVKKLNNHGGVCIKCVADDEQVEQDIVLDQPIEYIEDGVYTLSAKINNKIYSIVCNVVNSDFYYSYSIDELLAINLTRRSYAFNNSVFAQIIVHEGGYAELEWMKLEKGEYATPFISKNYSEELMDCQRYYEELVINGMINKTDILIFHKFLVNKRIRPTISICNGWNMEKTEGEINVVDKGTCIVTEPSVTYDIESIRAIRSSQNIYLKSDPTKTFTSGYALVYLIIDAEIY